MLVDETITNIQRALAHFRALDPRLDEFLNAKVDVDIGLAEAGVAAIQNVASDAQIVQLQQAGWMPPVIGAPTWFLEEVATTFGQERTDYHVDQLCGLKVIQRDELSEPLIVLQDGKHYAVVPDWARRAAEQLQAEEAARVARAGIITPPTEVVVA
jgi:hypothetical protein